MTTVEHELEIALRAETPRPSPEFSERLDRAVADGFPRRKRLRLPATPWPAVATGVALVVAIVVGVSLAGGGSDHTSQSGSSGASVATPADKGAPALSAPAVRRVERAASLALGAPRSKLEDVANQIVAVVDRHHGFVLHSTVTSGEGGSFEVRVPSVQLQQTLSDLSGLANVRSRSQSTDDITAPYNAVAAQLSEARALRHSLLARLAQATTDTQAKALRRRIRLVSAQIRSLTARFGALQNRARFATIDVTLLRERARHSGGSGGGIGSDFHAALHSLVVSFGIALRILGVVLPLALVGALAWLATALLRRRRREAALL